MHYLSSFSKALRFKFVSVLLKVYEALEILEKEMLQQDRVLPSQYVFTVLIGVLGRVGYTQKAFQLFNKVCGVCHALV